MSRKISYQSSGSSGFECYKTIFHILMNYGSIIKVSQKRLGLSSKNETTLF